MRNWPADSTEQVQTEEHQVYVAVFRKRRRIIQQLIPVSETKVAQVLGSGTA
jgi:hypothetical protein